MPTENELLIQALRAAPQSSMVWDDSGGFTGGVGGADRSGGIQPNLAEPNQIAAYRMARAVAPEQGRQDSGAAQALGSMVPGIAPLQQLAAGDYGGAATSTALSAIPFGLAKLGRFAAPALQGWYGSSLLAPEALAEDKPKNPFTFDEAGYEKRRKAVLKDGSPRALREFEAREGQARAETQQKAAAWEEANQGKIQAANALEGYKRSVAPSAQVLKKEVQEQIQNAPTQEAAQKIYTDAMNEYTKSGRTIRENYPEAVEGANVVAALLGGRGAYKIASKRADDLRSAELNASKAYDARFGPGAPTDKVSIAQNDALLNKKLGELQGATNMPQHPGWGTSARMVSYPLIASATPSAIDAAVTPRADVRDKALNEIIPGYMPNPQGIGGRDWTALSNIGRALFEGGITHAGGSALASGRDYEKLKNMSNQTIKNIKDQQKKVAAELKTPRARSAPQPLPMSPTPTAPSAAPITAPTINPASFPDNWGKIGGVQDYTGAILKNMQNKMGTNLPISGVKKRKD